MSLETRVMDALKEAMKAKDDAAKRSLRSIKSAILLLKTDGSGKEIDKASEIKLLQKLVKQRQDSLAIYLEQGREDLAQTEREEIAVIEKFLPQQIPADKLRQFIQNLISEVGAESMKDMGKVMGMATSLLAGRADGKVVSALVRELLSR